MTPNVNTMFRQKYIYIYIYIYIYSISYAYFTSFLSKIMNILF